MKPDTRSRSVSIFCVALCAVALLTPEALHAYGGPGSVVTGLGALLAVLAAIGAAIFGFVWYPVKRIVRKIRGSAEEEGDREMAEMPEELARE